MLSHMEVTSDYFRLAYSHRVGQRCGTAPQLRDNTCGSTVGRALRWDRVCAAGHDRNDARHNRPSRAINHTHNGQEVFMSMYSIEYDKDTGFTTNKYMYSTRASAMQSWDTFVEFAVLGDSLRLLNEGGETISEVTPLD